MFTATTENTTALRNYAIAAATVILVGAGVADFFNNPARVGRQDRLDGYGRYVSAGLVSYARGLSR